MVGEVKRGKSSLVNALLGARDASPGGNIPGAYGIGVSTSTDRSEAAIMEGRIRAAGIDLANLDDERVGEADTARDVRDRQLPGHLGEQGYDHQ